MDSRLLASIFLFLMSIPAFAQMPGSAPPLQFPQTPVADPGAPMADAEDATARMAHELEVKAEQQRVVQLKLDTDKLLKLSVELKSYVDKTDTNVLSLDVMKKAEEIEKLAKSVHDKMRGPN